MRHPSIKTVFFKGCLILIMLSLLAGCSQYEGTQSKVYQNVNSYLNSLKKSGRTDQELENDNFFASFSQESSSLPESFKKEYLKKAFRSWRVESIEDTDDGIQAQVALESSDLNFLSDSELQTWLYPKLITKAEELREANIPEDQVQNELKAAAYTFMTERLEQAQPLTVYLSFNCSAENGEILSVSEVEK